PLLRPDLHFGIGHFAGEFLQFGKDRMLGRMVVEEITIEAIVEPDRSMRHDVLLACEMKAAALLPLARGSAKCGVVDASVAPRFPGVAVSCGRNRKAGRDCRRAQWNSFCR